MSGFDFPITPETTILDLTKAVGENWQKTGKGGARFKLQVPMHMQQEGNNLAKMMNGVFEFQIEFHIEEMKGPTH
jgi:hypothetical protein